jgi:phosphoenolpyruvate carboxylase
MKPASLEQNPDVRFLGKLLGDVIRTYGGDALFRRIEHIRSTSVDRHRGMGAADAIDAGLDALSLDDTLAFVRGFMLFSLLANLAEDRQGVSAEPGATLAEALERLAEGGISKDEVAAFLDKALMVPVLTAHPTEVRRKSIIDHRNRIAELMRLRDAGAAETEDGDPVELALTRQIALLWRTRPLRRERLYVADEVETALSYLRDVFLPVLPTLYARWERALGRRPPSFLKVGSWIGGDRDGNPYVDAASLELALGSAAEAVIVYYLDAVHALGAEISISSELADVPPDVDALADRSGDQGVARADEPWRRALSGIYGRLAATYRKFTGEEAPRPATVAGTFYAGPDEFRAELDVIAEGLGEIGEGGPLARLIRAVETFGFHLATLDLRQNADVHERVVAELLKVAGVEPDYLALGETGRVALLRNELAGSRPLASPFADYSEETKSELAIVRAAAEARSLYGAGAITTYLISKAAGLSDLLETDILLKEAGLWRAGKRPRRR